MSYSTIDSSTLNSFSFILLALKGYGGVQTLSLNIVTMQHTPYVLM
jgi:hypothetical protein